MPFVLVKFASYFCVCPQCCSRLFTLQPSHDLRELASAQLRSMFQVLSRLSTTAAAGGSSSSSGGQHTASTCRACVYARRAESLGAPQIRLQRVACWPGAAAQQPHSSGSSSSSSSYEEMDDVLTLQRPAWEAGSGSSGACDTEASLCQEDVLLLPNSNMIVLPLAEAGVLVGLLVVEVPDMPAGSPSSSSSSSNAQPASPWDPPSSNSQMGLPEDALWCFRMAVLPLAKACAMDLRAALAGAQQEAQQRLARSLLLEAQGPLKVLGTFGKMLAPRLRSELAGQPESDMADGMVMQGQRLADVVAQLEAALRPQAGSRGLRQQQQLALPAAADAAAAGAVMPGMGMPGVAYDSFDDIEDIDLPDVWHTDDQQQQPQQLQQQQPQQQQQQPAMGLPSGVTAKAGYLPEHTSSSSSASTASSSTAVQPSSSQPQELPHLPGQGTAGSLGSSSRDIRWGWVESPAAATAATTATISSSSSSKECSASYSVAPGQLDMQKTIDLEVMGVEGTLMSIDADSSTSSSSSSATVATAPAWLSSSRSSSPSDAADSSSQTSSSRRGSSSSSSSSRRSASVSSVAVQQPASCNLIDTIGHLLTAAANLALVEGKNFIVTPPLQLDQAVTPPAGSSSGAGALLPRPIRPLLVGLAASTCRRVLGYVLDVALQCTPRGGQLSVTARESSGGVELSLLHTGQVQASRVHTTSKALSPALHSSSSSGAAQQQPGVTSNISSSSTFAVDAASSAKRSSGSSKRSRRVVQELSSSASSRGSSSSLVSLDFAGQVLQEIGGRLAVVYPIQFMNAVSGNLEVGSSIEVWLPPPVQGATV
jgi:hypothetical protein